MLRFALLVLLLANAGYLAWSQGWMATLGWAPEIQSEPYRLKQQVRPDVLSVIQTQPPTPTPPTAAAVTQQAAAPTEPFEEVLPEPTVCLQTDPMNEVLSKQLQAKLYNSDLPLSSWEEVSSSLAGRWMVYLGKFANEMAMEKRRAELRAQKIAYDRAGGNLELGLSLGRFSTEEAATRELSHMLSQGVRGARVVQERAPQTLYTIRLSQSTAAQRHILKTLQPALNGQAFHVCSS